MKEQLMKMLEKKPKMDPKDQEAKLSVLHSLKQEMRDMMKGDLKPGMKKVEVVAPDSEGLKEGLEKAEDLMGGPAEEDMEDAEEAKPMSAMESPALEAMEKDPMEEMMSKLQHAGPEEIDALMKKLMELKAQKVQE